MPSLSTRSRVYKGCIEALTVLDVGSSALSTSTIFRYSPNMDFVSDTNIKTGKPQTRREPYDNQDYTVAWICPQPYECKAAELMLSETHGHRPKSQSESDQNVYTLGQLHGHNIVLVALPSGDTGSQSATILAQGLRSTFQKIEFGCIIGSAGAISATGPGNKDIRLGDVVVSVPDSKAEHGGVVEFRVTPQGDFETVTRSRLNNLSWTLRSAVSVMESERYDSDQLWDKVIEPKLRKQPDMSDPYWTKHRKPFTFPGRNPEDGFDILFKSSYEHNGPQTKHCRDVCNWGAHANLIHRTLRSHPSSEESTAGANGRVQPTMVDNNPYVHLGLIATGAGVVDSLGSTERDRLRAATNALCFDKEAFGILTQFSTYLVIRGICNYSDSHTNSTWQRYAAIAAAAYAGELLKAITPRMRRDARILP
ncbi:purine and uridine phosphorylase [Ascobolus immersus RN42]|uniref:Purine and uridine phosphorylase n=1 Tax=Ascobolus immersus RN42 TaxID=1160509 RepID=A0A3N4I4N1_ASCIM|nr:purine and uridine phosphorylase [Ascobolus immersus RN42]